MYLFFESLFYRVTEFKSSPARIPCSVLVSTILTPLIEKIIPLSVVTDVRDRDSYVIFALFHLESIPWIPTFAGMSESKR